MDKKELICVTARHLIVENGLHNTSIGMIAKKANIPVGSVYTYFESKEALINETFLLTKNEINQYIFEVNIPDYLSVKEELYIYWQRAITFGLSNSEKFYFAEQLINSPIIHTPNQTSIRQQAKKVFDLLEKGMEQNIIKRLPVGILQNIVYHHIVGMVKYFSFAPENFFTLKEALFDSCWDAIKL
jgi:TetR/AcrR family transcriptional regulator, repressor of fatR-cypB operon